MPSEDIRHKLRESITSALHQGYQPLFGHRNNIAHYDLSSLRDHNPPQHVTITHFQPDGKRIRNLVAKATRNYAHHFPTEEMQQLTQETIEDFRKENTPAAIRPHYRRAGNSTVLFLESSQSTWVDFAINHTYVSLSPKTQAPLTDYLPQLLQCHSAIEHIAQDKTGDTRPFPEVIHISDEYGVVSTGPGNCLNLSPKLLQETPAHLWLTILRHERGHFLNGDTDKNAMHTEAAAATFNRASILKNIDLFRSRIKSPSAYFFQPDFQERFDKDKQLFEKTVGQILAAAEHIEAFPDYDELDSLAIAADLTEETGLAAHIRNGPAVDGLDALFDLMRNVSEHSNPPSRDISREQDKAVYEEARSNLGRFADTCIAAGDLHKAIGTLEKAYYKMAQAREHLADIHSLQHTENPHDVPELFRHFEEVSPESKNNTPISHRTHPLHQERASTTSHFAERVIRLRQERDGQDCSR